MSCAAFFERHVANFRAKRWSEMVDDYASPFAIYIGDDIATFPTKADIVHGLVTYDRMLRRFDIVRGVPVIDILSLPRRGRQVAHVTWHHLAADDRVMHRTVSRYYLRRDSAGRCQIQLMEFESGGKSPIPAALMQEFVAA